MFMSKVHTIIITVCLFTISSVFDIAQASTNQADQTTTQTNMITTQEDFRFNNENWLTTEHPEPAYFAINEFGEIYGMTTTNIPFTQTNLPNELGVRVQKFVIQDHYHYIVDGNIAYTDAELAQNILMVLDKHYTSENY